MLSVCCSPIIREINELIKSPSVTIDEKFQVYLIHSGYTNITTSENMATQVTLGSSKMIGKRKNITERKEKILEKEKKKKYQESDTIGRVLNNV